MTIYILKRYPTPHHMRDAEDVIGYFTSVTALQKALWKFKKTFGVFDNSGYVNAVACKEFSSLYNYADLVAVEQVDANELQYEVEDFIDAE